MRSFPLAAPPSTLVSKHLIFQKEKRPVGTFVFLEQVTRVELAGNSLGSCRHTARRHLLLFLFVAKINICPINMLIIAVFKANVNDFLPLFFTFLIENRQAPAFAAPFCLRSFVLTASADTEKLDAISLNGKIPCHYHF